jgi:hypothetical protein
VKRSRYIVEIELEVMDEAPEKYLKKEWSPEAKHYAKTAQTAKVIRVIKGHRLKVGSAAESIFQPMGLGTADWRKLYAAKHFKAFGGDDLDGWMADTGWCNVSVCAGYEEALAEVEKCLASRPAEHPRRTGARMQRPGTQVTARERTGEQESRPASTKAKSRIPRRWRRCAARDRSVETESPSLSWRNHAKLIFCTRQTRGSGTTVTSSLTTSSQTLRHGSVVY